MRSGALIYQRVTAYGLYEQRHIPSIFSPRQRIRTLAGPSTLSTLPTSPKRKTGRSALGASPGQGAYPTDLQPTVLLIIPMAGRIIVLVAIGEWSEESAPVKPADMTIKEGHIHAIVMPRHGQAAGV
jgi:hypothetical protein